ncbi:heme-binding protein 2 [Sebastes umbrosus]|uniref:heme-binding protein 2 n=1 Tax=Sebastes umbrosus TaxID=72105 RepID=UPI00189DD0D9|nr:heme-binding protein 2 [Sebastes umbrosus]
MIYLSGLVGFLLVLTAEARIGNSSELSFCTETKECLLFDPVCETSVFEARHYDSQTWVSTNETSICMEFASMGLFRRLFGYITGNNVDGKQIIMTAPVLIKMPKAGYFFKSYTMSFLLPAGFQGKAPQPTDTKVYIEQKPKMKVYAKSFGGWMMTGALKNQASSLATALDLVEAEYKEDFYYAVGYNSPMKVFNRHNEVWFVGEDKLVCAAKDSSSEEI